MKDQKFTLAEAFVVGIVFFIAFFGVFFAYSLYNAWAASLVWSWLIVPQFNVPAYSITQFFCAFFFISMVRAKITKTKSDLNWSVILFGPILCVGVAFIIKCFI